MKEIRFTKMHGISNDYIYINCMSGVPDNLSALSTEMSKRHTGVGGDGIILICPSEVADFKMRIFNADGSEAKMCGNGSRCVGKYVYDKGLTDKTDITLETLAGIKRLHLILSDGAVDSVRVDMGEPTLSPPLIPVSHPGDSMIEAEISTSAGAVKMTAVSMGNPHGVIFVSDPDKVDVHRLGRELETSPIWPDRANIEFAQIMSPRELKMRVWERGSGETMACGTGACATAVAAIITGKTDRRVTVHLRGGDLDIEWNATDNHIYMTGTATEVFEGKYFRRISD
ncbi:MAG: diaminopimelate epimerase [Muribaculum sp.]|nr:diaminopimelate epimerase [Muribaculum sp.]